MSLFQVTYRRSMNHLQWSFMHFLDALGCLAEGMEKRGIKATSIKKIIQRLEILHRIIECKYELILDQSVEEHSKKDGYDYVIDQRNKTRYLTRISQKLNNLKLKLQGNRYQIWLMSISMPSDPAQPWLWPAVKIEERCNQSQ